MKQYIYIAKEQAASTFEPSPMRNICHASNVMLHNQVVDVQVVLFNAGGIL